MESLEYPWPETPPPGETIAVGPGIHWLSMPLPFQLDHINLWLLEDDGGWTIVELGDGQVSGLPRESDAKRFHGALCERWPDGTELGE